MIELIYDDTFYRKWYQLAAVATIMYKNVHVRYVIMKKNVEKTWSKKMYLEVPVLVGGVMRIWFAIIYKPFQIILGFTFKLTDTHAHVYEVLCFPLLWWDSGTSIIDKIIGCIRRTIWWCMRRRRNNMVWGTWHAGNLFQWTAWCHNVDVSITDDCRKLS